MAYEATIHHTIQVSAMADAYPAQTPASDPEKKRIERYAIKQLGSILCYSLAANPPIEWGGVIYRWDAAGRGHTAGQLDHTGYFISEGSSINVNVGQDKPNCGCPEGSTPVAWFHTHPRKETKDHVQLGWDQFVEGDVYVSDNWGIPGYVATMDGRVWRYDPPPTVGYNNGRPTQQQGVEGTYGTLPAWVPVLENTVPKPRHDTPTETHEAREHTHHVSPRIIEVPGAVNDGLIRH
jgi:hypothetical protein